MRDAITRREEHLRRWATETTTALQSIGRLRGIAEGIRGVDAELREQTPLNISKVFTATNDLRNMLHRRKKQH